MSIKVNDILDNEAKTDISIFVKALFKAHGDWIQNDKKVRPYFKKSKSTEEFSVSFVSDFFIRDENTGSTEHVLNPPSVTKKSEYNAWLNDLANNVLLDKACKLFNNARAEIIRRNSRSELTLISATLNEAHPADTEPSHTTKISHTSAVIAPPIASNKYCCCFWRPNNPPTQQPMRQRAEMEERNSIELPKAPSVQYMN